MRAFTQGLVLALAVSACTTEDDPVAFLEQPLTPQQVEDQLAALRAEVEDALPKADRDAAEAYAADPPASSHPAGTIVHEPSGEENAWHMLGMSAFMQGRASLALWLFVRAAQLDPDDALALQQVGFVLAHQGRDDDARGLLVTAAEADDDLHSPEVELASLYERAGELDKALYRLSQAEADNPHHNEIKRSLAGVWTALGHPEAARSELSAALLLAPGDPILQAELDALPALPGFKVDAPLAPPRPPPDAAAEVRAIIADKREEVDAILEEHLDLIAEAQDGLVAVRQIDQALNLDRALGCTSACSDDGCRDLCAEQLCLDETGSHNDFRAAVRGSPGDVDGAYAAWLAGMGAVVFPTLDEHRRKLSDDEFDAIRTDFLAEAAGNATIVELAYVGVAGAIQIDAEQVRLTCQPVDTLEGPDPSAPLADPDPDDIDLCLDNVLCLGLNNDEITLGAFAGPLSFEVSVDTKTGAFAMEASLGVSDPWRVAKAGVGLRFHSSKGIGVTADAKVGGFLQIKATKEAYFVHFNLSDV